MGPSFPPPISKAPNRTVDGSPRPAALGVRPPLPEVSDEELCAGLARLGVQGGGVARETFQHREGVPSMFEKEDKAPFLDAPGGGASWRDRPGHVDNISEGAVPHNA